MYPAEFDYYRAESIEEALELLADLGEHDARVLAGGHSLLPEMKRRRRTPEALVDIGDVSRLGSIDARDGEIEIGALVNYAEMVDSEPLSERATALWEAAANLGDVQIRNRGTVGGNLAEADPAADLPAAALVADATIVLRDLDDERTIEADRFFRGDGETAIGDGELLTSVRVPDADTDGPAEVGGAYEKKTHPASGYAMVGIAARVGVEDGRVVDARVAANGVTDRAIRLEGVEDELVGTSVDDAEAIESAAARAIEDLESERLRSDPYASGNFRLELSSTYAERAVETAIDRATGPPERHGRGGDRR